MNPKLYITRVIILSDKDGQAVVDAIGSALSDSGCNIVKSQSHFFQPFGTTASWILEESSCVVHTYPDHQKVFVTLETCDPSVDHQLFVDKTLQYLETNSIHRIALSEVFE